MAQNGEDDFEKNMPLVEAATGLLKTISTLVATVDSAPQVEKILFRLTILVTFTRTQLRLRKKWK
jgi:hypothetical protein